MRDVDRGHGRFWTHGNGCAWKKENLRARLAACFPAGFPAISPWRQAAWKVFTGHSTGAFGSLPNEDLQPDRAGFPRGNKPDLRTPGIVPRIDSTPPLPITTAALTSSSAVARHLGRALLLLPRRHYAYVLSSAPSHPPRWRSPSPPPPLVASLYSSPSPPHQVSRSDLRAASAPCPR